MHVDSYENPAAHTIHLELRMEFISGRSSFFDNFDYYTILYTLHCIVYTCRQTDLHCNSCNLGTSFVYANAAKDLRKSIQAI